jgi:hypothetical protein
MLLKKSIVGADKLRKGEVIRIMGRGGQGSVLLMQGPDGTQFARKVNGQTRIRVCFAWGHCVLAHTLLVSAAACRNAAIASPPQISFVKRSKIQSYCGAFCGVAEVAWTACSVLRLLPPADTTTVIKALALAMFPVGDMVQVMRDRVING